MPSGISVSGNVTLCLNGHKLTYTGNGDSAEPIINIPSGATLTLCDCNGGQGKHYYTVDGDGKYTFTDQTTSNSISGGVVTGGLSRNGDRREYP